MTKPKGDKKPNAGMVKVVEIVGSQRKLALLLGITQPLVHHYMYEVCPAEKAVMFEKLFGVSRKLFRPDLWE